MKKIIEKNYKVSAIQWRMLGYLLVIQVLVAFAGRSLGPLGAVIGNDLSLTKAQIGLLPAALFLGQSIVSIPAGFLVDRIGSRRMLLSLAICLGGSFILVTFASNLAIVLIIIAVGGLGYGTVHPTSNHGILNWFTRNKRGMAMGIKQMGVTLGSALAALLLLPLAVEWGWRPALFSAGAILIAAGFIVYFLYKEPANNGLGNLKIKPMQFYTSFIAVIKQRALLLISLAALVLQGTQIILSTYLVLFSYERLGFSLVLSGVLLVLLEIGGSLGRVFWGIISDRLFNGRRIIILLIISIIALCGSLILAFLPKDTTFLMIAFIVLLFGFSVSGYNGIWMNATTENTSREQAGIATGYSIFMATWGVIIGPRLFGFIVDQSGTFTFGWLFVATAMVMIIILLIIAERNLSKEEKTN